MEHKTSFTEANQDLKCNKHKLIILDFISFRNQTKGPDIKSFNPVCVDMRPLTLMLGQARHTSYSVVKEDAM